MSTTTPKQLAQSAPVANTNTTVYTVPAATTTILSGIMIANTGGAADTVKIFVVPSAGAAGVGNTIIPSLSIPVANPFAANIAVTLNTGGFIVVFSLLGTSTFTLSGAEIT